MNNDELFVGTYLVVFVDILGQQDILRQIQSLPNKSIPEQKEEFEGLLKKTIGTVDAFRRMFNNFFQESSKRYIDLNEFTEEQKQLYEKSKSNEIKSYMFSDFVMLFLSLRDDINKVPMSGVFLALASAASTFLAMLAGGHVIRGGIDIGLGVEFWKGEIYGPALARAYALESKIAQYPRIILGEELTRYIQLQRSRPQNDVFSVLNKHLADLCSMLVAIDDDGYPFLDYLGEGFKKHIMTDLDQAIINKAFEFVIRESERCKVTKNSKLAFRYSLLRDYIEHRKDNWITS